MTARGPSKPYPLENPEGKKKKRKRGDTEVGVSRQASKRGEETTPPLAPPSRLQRNTAKGWRLRGRQRWERRKEVLSDRDGLEEDPMGKGRIMEVLEQRGRDRGSEAGVRGKGRGDPVAGVGDNASGPCPRWGIRWVEEQHGGCTGERVARAPVAARSDDGMKSLRPDKTPSGGPEKVGAGMGSAKPEEERGGSATLSKERGAQISQRRCERTTEPGLFLTGTSNQQPRRCLLRQQFAVLGCTTCRINTYASSAIASTERGWCVRVCFSKSARSVYGGLPRSPSPASLPQ